ncbi:hypothetical protein CHS0354_029761 [Potamilus streckersoni]|uniref:APCDD1 domain-containing protein n=1 Tax=Potamilus streckersoni TaxID=2493646 RepID=A0AAE0TH60_9BIVA|nr:hypothetical protein CHS0354_029761 [Potamilus streckersoni]
MLFATKYVTPETLTQRQFPAFLKTEGCQVCESIVNSNDFLPPVLHQHGEQSHFMPGQWVSERCETRQNGQFLTRMLTFLPDGKSWQCQYDFYNDPLCRDSSFTVYGKGHYLKERKSPHIPSATEFTFRTTNLKIEPKDFWILEYLNSYEGKQCGKPKSWKLGVEQDVTITGGCITLGIQLPNIEYELIKQEFLNGKEIIFVGQKPSDGELMQNRKIRPTSFQSPLVKCGRVSQMNAPSLRIQKLEQKYHEISSAENSISSGLQIYCDAFLLFACMLSWFM